MSGVKTISIEQLDQRLKSGAAFQFWNVLSDQYFNGELIVGSLRVPVDTVGREASRLGLPKDGEIIVYCSDYNCSLSRKAAEKLGTLGFTNVRAYEGGLVEWKDSGRSVAQLVTALAA